MTKVSSPALAALLLFACHGPAPAAAAAVKIKQQRLRAKVAYSDVTHAKDNPQEEAHVLSQVDADSWHLSPLRAEPPHQESGSDGVINKTLTPSEPNTVLVNDTVVEAMAAEVSQLRPGDIPKFIHATWISWPTLHKDERAFADKWARLNPTWKYYFWDDSAMKNFLRRQLSPQEYQKLVKMKPVEACDVFRYTVLERLGGLYCDIDVEPVLPIEEWWGKVMKDPRPQLVTGWESRFTNLTEKNVVGFSRVDQVQQWLIMSAPHHPILQNVISRVFNIFSRSAYTPTLELTGPGPWTDAVLAYIADVGVGVPPAVGHGEGRANEVSYRGLNPVHLLPKESFAWGGFPENVGDPSEMLATHHFKHSWVNTSVLQSA